MAHRTKSIIIDKTEYKYVYSVVNGFSTPSEMRAQTLANVFRQCFGRVVGGAVCLYSEIDTDLVINRAITLDPNITTMFKNGQNNLLSSYLKSLLRGRIIYDKTKAQFLITSINSEGKNTDDTDNGNWESKANNLRDKWLKEIFG